MSGEPSVQRTPPSLAFHSPADGPERGKAQPPLCSEPGAWPASTLQREPGSRPALAKPQGCLGLTSGSHAVLAGFMQASSLASLRPADSVLSAAPRSRGQEGARGPWLGPGLPQPAVAKDVPACVRGTGAAGNEAPLSGSCTPVGTHRRPAQAMAERTAPSSSQSSSRSLVRGHDPHPSANPARIDTAPRQPQAAVQGWVHPRLCGQPRDTQPAVTSPTSIAEQLRSL